MRSYIALAAFAVMYCASRPPEIPSQITIPIVAYPLNESILKNEEVIAGFASLVEKSGFSRRADERAAFLILNDDGHFRFLLWPATRRFMAASWHGPIPEGTVAIVHTHPEQEPYSSVHDMDEARRIGAPIFVLTRTTIALVSADGQSRTLLENREWAAAQFVSRK